jgi:hypothetical protein
MRTRRTHFDANAERLETKRRELKDKQFRKAHEDGNAYFSEADVRPDPYHSGDAPCCRLGLQVVEKLFPEIDGLGVVERKTARGDAASVATSAESTGEPSEKTGPGDEENDGGEQAMELMALLIRTHLLEERRRARGGGGDGDGGGGNSGGNAGGKKKKKKKKRKKGAGAEADAEAAATPAAAAVSATAASGDANDQTASVASLEHDEDDKDGNKISAAGGGGDNNRGAPTTTASSSSSPSGVAQLSVSPTSSPAKAAADGGDAGASLAINDGGDNPALSASLGPASVDNGAKDAGSARSPLDCFLDQILQQEGGSSKGRTGTSTALPANRDLASFTDFLNTRYLTYLDQKREESSGGGRRKKSDHHRTFDSMEVLPTISFRVLERQAENPACSKCRTGSFTKVHSSCHEGTEQVTHSFTITDESTAWPPKEGTARLQQIEALIHSADGIEMTHAFDYVALEEGQGSGFTEDDGYGGGKPDRDRFKITLEGSVPLKSSALRDIRHYERRHPSLQRERPEFLAIIPPRVSEGESPQILSQSDIIHLVTQVLVPGTLDLANWVGDIQSDGDGVNEDVYSKEEYRPIIEAGAKEYCKRGTKKLKDLKNLRDQIMDEESRVRAMLENDFKPHEAKHLRKAEELCDSYLEKATALLEKFIQMSLGVCSEDTLLGKWARGVIQEFMDKVDMAYSESVEEVTAYQRKIGERFRNAFPGSRPSCNVFSINSAVPEFRYMVNKKIEAISIVHSALEETLLSQSSIFPNLTGMECFCAASIYYAFPEEVAVEGDRNDSLQGSRVPAAANSIESVAESVRQKRQIMCCTSWQDETIKDKLLEHKRKATISCGNELDHFEAQVDVANIDVNDVGTDAGAFTSIILRLAKYEKSTDYRTRVCQEEDDADWFAESAEDVVGYHNRRTSNLYLKWWLLRLRRFKKSQMPVLEPVPNKKRRLNDLPRRYVKWAERAFSAGNVDMTEDADVCPGYGRDRRVSCLIAAMLYGWLQDRCVEWDAELTQKEVLAAMENDEEFFASDPSPAEKESSKSSKKKKKKVKKKAGADTGPETIVTAVSDDANATPKDEPLGVEKNDPANKEEKDVNREEQPKTPSNFSSKQNIEGSEEAKSIDQPFPDNEEGFTLAASTKKAKKKKRNKSAPAAEEAPQEKSTPIENEDGDDALQINYVSEVAVQDGNELIPVEYFLVRRLRAIISQAKRNASLEPNAKKSEEKIVFL